MTAPRGTGGARIGRARRPHLLLVGPRIIPTDFIGGTKIVVERLVTDLKRRGNVSLSIVSTSRGLADRGRLVTALLNCMALARTLTRVWRCAPMADVVLWNVSAGGALLSGPLVWLLCVWRRRPLLVRLFGADFAERLAVAPAPIRFLATRTFLNADMLLMQTKHLTEQLGAFYSTMWFPNTRDMPRRRSKYRRTCCRLLFLSRLHPDKGLPHLLAAAGRFPARLHLSVYGPAPRSFDTRTIDDTANAAYYGPAQPQDVPAIMEAHDALVLPTRHPGEGYSGVIIEAFQMGLPVLVTPLQPIREFVIHERNGLHVAASPESILEAVVRICSDDRLFRRLREDALRTGERFRSRRAAASVEALCRQAADRRAPSCAAS